MELIPYIVIKEVVMVEKAKLQVPNLERGLQIIEYLVTLDEEISQKDIADTLGFPVNSTMRVLTALDQYGYVTRNPINKKYSLSNKLVTMSTQSASHKSLMRQSLDVMEALRDELKETVVISVLHDKEGVILEQVQGIHPFRFVCDPGMKQPLHSTASCKAILAFLGDKELEHMLKGLEYSKFTSNTCSSEADLLKELEQVREVGYSIDKGEMVEGVHCATAPIFDRTGRPVASITITGPSFRIPLESLPEIGHKMTEYTAKISQRLGYNGGINK